MATGLGQLTLLTLFGGALTGGDDAEPVRAVEVQRIQPVKQDRCIELNNISAFVVRKPLFGERVELRLGATATRATGHIVQTSGSFEDGTLRAETLHSAAWGLGPTVLASLKLFELERMTLNLDVGGSLMLYDRSFPAGGSRYNGMLQAGPSLSVALEKGRSVTVGARWTHISNGQGLGAHNPSFDGQGLFLRYERDLRRLLRGARDA